MLTAHEGRRISPFYESIQASLLKVCLYCRGSSHCWPIRLPQNRTPAFLPEIPMLVGTVCTPQHRPFSFIPTIENP